MMSWKKEVPEGICLEHSKRITREETLGDKIDFISNERTFSNKIK